MLAFLVLGETACGKTAAIKFLTRKLGCSLFVINVHGDMLSGDIWGQLAPAVAAANVSRDSWVHVCMDESNSTPDTWAVKECVCDGTCEGRALPENMCIISAINPTRLKPKDHGQGTHVGLEGGIDAHAHYDQLQRDDRGERIHESFAAEPGNLLKNSFHSTVYPVYPVPESILSLMWDFGNPSNHIWMDEEGLTGPTMVK